MQNTGFSWVRIDKGTIHCNFRYLNEDEVKTVINYLRSFYAYQNITFSIVDLGAAGMLQETGDHYRPSGADPSEDYYYLVELHRHGTIIPQGCVEILKRGINELVQHVIVPKYVFIQQLSSNIMTVGDTDTIHAISTSSIASDVTWASSEPSVISITPSGFNLAISADSPGTSEISVSVTVLEGKAIEIGKLPIASAMWENVIFKYTGPSTTTLTTNHYYTTQQVGSTWTWVESSYDGSPVSVTYTDKYTLIVKTYVRITSTATQRFCLYHYLAVSAYTPSTGLSINWESENDACTFDSGISVGSPVTLYGHRVGSTIIKASVTDSVGTYTDSIPMEVFAVSITPKEMKIVTGNTKTAVIKRSDIFDDDDPTIVNWVTSNSVVATVTAVPPESMVDSTTNFVECEIAANGVGTAFVTAVAEDPLTSISYTDSVKVTVGNIAIQEPTSRVISLLASSQTLTLECDLTPGFTVGASGWVSSNSSVVQVNTIAGADNSLCEIEGIAVGTAYITVTGTLGSATDTDTILIEVVDVPVVTAGEMATFTHGLYDDKSKVIDWDVENPESYEIEDGAPIELATQPEVDEFLTSLYDDSEESSESEESSGESEESSEEESEEP